MRSLRLQILLLFAVSFVSGTACAGGLRVTLLANAEVQGETIFLANLLPENASHALRTSAEAISLGVTPQIGSIRRFRGDAILAALQRSGLSSSFLIPEVVTVHRAGRTLSREEAFAAIQSALAKSYGGEPPQLHPEDLTFDTALEVPGTDSQLEVTQMAFDQAIGRARFRLQSRTAPGTNAFYVTAHVAPEAFAAVSANAVRPKPRTFTKSPAPADSPVLADPRQFARLHLRSSNSDMLLTVKPLERGHLGETIRVRLPSSGKTLQARVAGKNSLEAVF
jgi:hypothetical protein